MTIGDVAKIKHGFAFKGEFFTDEVTPNVLVTPGNFAVGGGFQIGKPKYYAGPLPEDYVLSEGEVVVTMTDLSKASDTLGYAAKIPGTPGVTYWHNQRIGLLQVTDEQHAYKDWLHYLMRTHEYRAWIVGSASGTTVKHTSPSRIESFSFKLPPLEEQYATAETLGALDDRIDNLRQTNVTLESISAALFKSRFVDFDGVLPGDMQESELGLIPKGWRIGTLGDVAEHPRRSVQPEEIESSTPYIALEHMPRRCIALGDWGMAAGLESNKYEFKRGEILFGKLRPYFHKVGVAPLDGVCSTDIVVIAPKSPAWFGFVLVHASSDEFVEYTNAGSTGTKMPRTSWREMSNYAAVLPPESIATAFNEQVQLIVEKIISNIHESRTLAALRDTLLPRLISGQLRVNQ